RVFVHSNTDTNPAAAASSFCRLILYLVCSRRVLTSPCGCGLRSARARIPSCGSRLIVVGNTFSIAAPVTLQLRLDPIHRRLIAIGTLPSISKLSQTFDGSFVLFKVQAADNRPDWVVGRRICPALSRKDRCEKCDDCTRRQDRQFHMCHPTFNVKRRASDVKRTFHDPMIKDGSFGRLAKCI